MLRVSNGVPMLTLITATGCAVTALIAAFVAVAPPEQRLQATAHALAVFGCAQRGVRRYGVTSRLHEHGGVAAREGLDASPKKEMYTPIRWLRRGGWT